MKITINNEKNEKQEYIFDNIKKVVIKGVTINNYEINMTPPTVYLMDYPYYWKDNSINGFVSGSTHVVRVEFEQNGKMEYLYTDGVITLY